MNTFNIGEVLTRAWNIIWKHKILWVFGIFAVFARGGGGSGSGNSSYQTSSDELPFNTDRLERGFYEFGSFLEQNWWIFIVIGVVIIVLSILFYALGIMGRIGLIQGVFKVEKGAETLTFAELWSESMPYFWRIFGLNFLIGLAILVVIFALFLPVAVMGVLTFGVALLCLIPLACILLPITWVITVIVEQAQPAIIAENLGMWDGFKRGWQIVKNNGVNFVLLALVLFIGGAIVGIVIALPIVLAVMPIIVGMNTLDQTLAPVYIALACCAVYLPVLYLLNGILAAYIQSVWTLTYLRLTAPADETPIFAEANA